MKVLSEHCANNDTQIIQMRLDKMATFCYMVGDKSSKTCALIDPAFDTKEILNKVNSTGFTVTHLINTHNHADHTAGNASIISKTGAALYIHKLDAQKLTSIANRTFSRMIGGSKSPKPQTLLEDNDTINIGNTKLKVLHTPGHTPGGICLYMEGNVFTGDTLFVGAVGRTDLRGGSMRKLLKSVHEKIYTLPKETRVWPGHDYGGMPYSTVENEMKTNPFTRRDL
ncbi:MAG: MBL fold metallo-hydrolase [Deltaproteobacteria bacterium]|nr:MBL fold metallo-hydrolase [Deltaproteobacteria bacterium]MBW1983127.1 MBL fold metallo-hydrolase [Deltaproteobacteria bacterium]MBW2179167.1 MBL fold metallo-hydrolase [Deltaproteobacteria bacterium]